MSYHVNDGAFSCLSNLAYGDVEHTAFPLTDRPGPVHTSAIWGQTSDDWDYVAQNAQLPVMESGDWLYFEDMGAYTTSASRTYNGFGDPRTVYTFTAPPQFNLDSIPSQFPIRPISKNLNEIKIPVVASDAHIRARQPTLESAPSPIIQSLIYNCSGAGQLPIKSLMQRLASTSPNRDAFFLLDAGDVFRKFEQWRRLLPRVEPFYAVKCNSDPVVLQSLHSLGTGFDCASMVEIQTMLDLGADPKKIIFAHPCKPPHHIKYALEHGVEMMTFDNIDELEKIKAIFPAAKLVVRVHTDDSKATSRVSSRWTILSSSST